MLVPSLRQRVSQISIGAFLAASAVMLAGFVVFSVAKQELSGKEIERDLRRNSAHQVEQLIPSFLLPEQNSGVELLLSRLSKEEDLTHALVLHSRADIPDAFSACQLQQSEISMCHSTDRRETAVITPIAESGRTFGYLLKARHNSSSWATHDILQLIAIMAAMLGLTFTAIYLFLARLLSRTLPSALDRLVAWIEADLSDRHTDMSPLPFQELESLKEKISEVLDRHNQDRDQAVIGQLTSGIMHDIRTPLQSVVTAMHLTEKYPSGDPKRLARLENLYLRCTEKLPIVLRIIDTTLDGSRQIQVNKTNFNLVTTVKGAISLNQQLVSLRKAEVEIKAPPEVEVPHDSIQIIRVLTNLVKNGIEAIAEPTKTPKIIVSIEQSNPDEILISVEDNGPGIPTPANRIFRAFRSSKIHGTGMGLHVSRKIIEAHRGRIHASNRSSLGGARFDVYLPLTVQDAAAFVEAHQ